MKAAGKPFNQIKIRIVHRAITNGLVSDIKTTAEVPLSLKLNDYIMRLGYSSSNLAGFIIELLTKGKVRMDFDNYTERLELIDQKDFLTWAQAMTLLANFMSDLEHSGMGHVFPEPSKATQKIVIKRLPTRIE